MSEVVFVTGPDHRLRMACAVVRRHYLDGQALAVYTRDARRLARFDAELWTFEPSAFIPHVAADDAQAATTPVILTADAAQAAAAARPWLLNLDLELPPQTTAFAHIIEVVSEHPQDREAARHRWVAYREQGHRLRTCTLAQYPETEKP